ncbi:MAG: tyrosine-type recombinase/integrase [Lentisphaerota bacterium]
MALQLKRKPDGSLAVNSWYADFMVDGKRQIVSLHVPVEGIVPKNLRQKKNIDQAFAQSRGAAQAAHDSFVSKARAKQNEQHLLERLIDMKTSDAAKSVSLDTLPAAWARIPRKREPSAQYMENSKKILSRLISYLQQKHPRAKDLSDITSTMIKGFMDVEQSRGLSAHTWNYVMELLRSTFRHLEPSAEAYRKYLSATPSKIEETIHREPFKPDEIQAILQAAADDELMRPLITTALCTAMRRGDCALLKWSAVDLSAGFIKVKTSKTGETVEIPIMPLLRDELVRAQQGRDADGFVFPKAATIYQHNADGLNVRLRQILFKAGFVDTKTAEKVKKGERTLPILPPEEVRTRGLEAIKDMAMIDAKRERITNIFTQYLNGQTVPAIAEDMQISKGTVSGLLNEIEKKMGVAVIHRRGPVLPETIRGVIHSEGQGQRLKRGSLRGWHSFRTTFITLALSAGLPMELVRRITGHTTVDVVLKHYFRPGREDFRRAMQSVMPKMLTKGEKSPKEELLEIVERILPKIGKKDAARLCELASKL